MERLTKAEEKIMNIVWDLGPCTVKMVIDKLGEPRPPHSSISSIIRLIEKKGYLDHKAYGRTYEYAPKISKESYGKSSLNILVNSYFKGSFNELVSFMVKDKAIDSDELEKYIEELKNQES